MSEINDFLNANGVLLILDDLPGMGKLKNIEDSPVHAAASVIVVNDMITGERERPKTSMDEARAMGNQVVSSILKNTSQVFADCFNRSNPEVVDLVNHSQALFDAVEESDNRFIDGGKDEDGEKIYENLKIARDGTVVCEIDANVLPLADAPYFPVNGLYRINMMSNKPAHADNKVVFSVAENIPSCAPFNSESLIDTVESDDEFPIHSVFDFNEYRNDHTKRYSMVLCVYNPNTHVKTLLPCFAEVHINWHSGKILILMGLMENRIKDFPQTIDRLGGLGQSQKFLKLKVSLFDAVFMLLVANGIINADPAIVSSATTPPGRLAAAAKKRRIAAKVVHKIALKDLRYDRSRWIGRHLNANGVAWHCVRGHFRNLSSPQYTKKQGARVWVRPHTRGKKALGEVNHVYRKR